MKFVLKRKKYQKPFNGNSLPLVFAPVFNIINTFHDYANEIKFSNRSMASIYSSNDILPVQQQCHNDGLDLKIVYLCILNQF